MPNSLPSITQRDLAVFRYNGDGAVPSLLLPHCDGRWLAVVSGSAIRKHMGVVLNGVLQEAPPL